MTFVLDPRLAADTHKLGELALSEVLLMDNALLPWFILVPRVTETELFQLDDSQRQQLFDETTALSAFVSNAFSVDKLNVAAIGNVVAQLHVHVVGRRRDDFAWPGVVWGRPEREAYLVTTVAGIQARLATEFGSDFKIPGGEEA
jgi:diadenosine tetraphosphate (Ap4A) HIT family hydrolase